uniref:IF rod domain-containing protein n=1 Tax=Corvus moneduloides TaxID=1196302 RepID=A0A8C3GTM3_CORMO
MRARHRDIACRSWARALARQENKVRTPGKGGVGPSSPQNNFNPTETPPSSQICSGLTQDQLVKALQELLAELGAAAANTEQFGESTVMDAKDKLSELEAALEKAEADLALQLCEFRELRNLKLALAMEIVTFRELLEGAESRRGTGLQDSSAASVPWAGRENSCTEQSQSCESTRQSCTGQLIPSQQSCKRTPGANPTVPTVQYRIRLPLEAKGVGIFRQ